MMPWSSIVRVASLVILVSPWSASAAHNTLSDAELSDGWILLFDGESTFGWEATSDADWNVDDGVLSATMGQPGFLNTTSEFGDFELKVEFRAEEGTNSGIFLRNARRPMSPAKDCYELNIADETISPFPTGSFVERARAKAPMSSTEWQRYEVKATGGHFLVKLNGVQVLDYTDPKPLGRGRIGLQFRSGKISFRSIKIKPKGLHLLFNERDLEGWKTYPDMQSVFSVTPDGALNVKNGKGQLESTEEFGDFVLRWEVFSNGKQLNSGVFFRCIPGETMNGYECQIHNGFKDDDRTQPIDCGTGGFYRRQNARKVLGDDFQWVPMTLVASGDHMACWVRGIQVSDWTDTRDEHDNPRNGRRLKPGTLMIQGHDPTTDLSFRKIFAGETPAR